MHAYILGKKHDLRKHFLYVCIFCFFKWFRDVLENGLIMHMS